MSKHVPYASATSGNRGREEVIKILRRLGCQEIGFADKFDTQEVLLYFRHRGQQVQLCASAKGWAQMFLKEHPYSYRCRRSRTDYEQDALRQGHVVVNSILRDWTKAQVTAIECGILSFEAVFAPHMLTADGRPLLERLKETDLLPAPEQEKVASLPSRPSS